MAIKPYKGSEPYIFISYAHKNMTEALEIIGFLQQSGYRVWFDEGIDPGTEWDMNIATHINNCGCFVALVSPEYIASDNCCDELNYARDKKRENRLLIYLSEAILPDGMAMRMNRIQAIFKYKYADQTEFYEKLRESAILHSCLDSAAEPSPVMNMVFSAPRSAVPEFSPVSSAFAPSAPSATSDRFILGPCIGKGGYGSVYRGVDTHTGRDVVIHRWYSIGWQLDEIGILGNEQLRSVLLSLEHPGLCKCLAVDINRMSGYASLITEYVDGRTLTEKMTYYTTAPASAKLLLLTRVADALACLHEHGIYYGDLSPDNIMIRNDGRACLTDYSDVNVEGTYFDSKTLRIHFSDFQAPECRTNGPYDRRTDIYSFGRLIAYLDLYSDLPPNAQNRLTSLIVRTTQTKPVDRPYSIAAVAEQLSDIVNNRL